MNQPNADRASILSAWSRRDFFKRGAGFAALAALGTSILNACTTALAPRVEPQGPKPVRGGTVSEAPTVEPVNLNPLMASSGQVAMFDGLLTLLVDGSPTPLLAQSLPKISADGTTYTFELRKDVKWTDGTPLTADDVVFTYRLMYHPDYKPFATPYRSDLEGLLSDVQAPDRYTVVIKTKTPSASFLALHSRYGVLPKHVLGNVPAASLKDHAFNKAPTVTNGPFKFKEWIPGDHLTVVRNDEYYRGAPYLDSYVSKFVPQQANIPVVLKTGEVDATLLKQSGVYEDIKASPNLNMSLFPTGNCPRIWYNLEPSAPASKIFSSKAVRQALLYGANRDGAAKATLFGYGSRPSSIGVSWPGNWADNPDAKPTYAYDKKKAEELLEADGWKKNAAGIREKNGLPLKFELLTSANNNIWQQISQVFAQNWKDIGVGATVVPLQFAQVTTRTLAREFDMVMNSASYLNFADPDPSTAFHSRNAVKNSTNYSNYKNPQLDQLLDQAVATLDQTKRKDLYFKIQDILNEDVPSWSTWFPQYAWVTNKRVKFAGPERIGGYTWSLRAFVNEWYVTDGK